MKALVGEMSPLLFYLSNNRLEKNMKHFTDRKRANIHTVYGLTEGNEGVAQAMYPDQFPQKDVPDRHMFPNVHYSLCEYRSLRCSRHS